MKRAYIRAELSKEMRLDQFKLSAGDIWLILSKEGNRGRDLNSSRGAEQYGESD